MIALVGALTLTLTSCDECRDVTCENGGTCAEGICECADDFFGDACEAECVNGTYADGTCGCDAGYEGEACTVLSRADMIGSYTGNDACSSTGASSDYNSIVTASSASDEGVLISGLWAKFFINTISGTVDGNVITIANQEPDGDGFTIEGTGTYTDGGIAWNFTITEIASSDIDQCTMSAVKQ